MTLEQQLADLTKRVEALEEHQRKPPFIRDFDWLTTGPLWPSTPHTIPTPPAAPMRPYLGDTISCGYLGDSIGKQPTACPPMDPQSNSAVLGGVLHPDNPDLD